MRSIRRPVVFLTGVIALALACRTSSAPTVQRPTLAPYVPTPQDVVDRMLAFAEVTSNDVVYDLGSGDGRIVITAAKKYGARGVGIEIDPALVKTANTNAAAAGVSNRV